MKTDTGNNNFANKKITGYDLMLHINKIHNYGDYYSFYVHCT